ncbi:hypothetical protein RFI_33629, partial [Reticulomyxa filosa]
MSSMSNLERATQQLDMNKHADETAMPNGRENPKSIPILHRRNSSAGVCRIHPPIIRTTPNKKNNNGNATTANDDNKNDKNNDDKKINDDQRMNEKQKMILNNCNQQMAENGKANGFVPLSLFSSSSPLSSSNNSLGSVPALPLSPLCPLSASPYKSLKVKHVNHREVSLDVNQIQMSHRNHSHVVVGIDTSVIPKSQPQPQSQAFYPNNDKNNMSHFQFVMTPENIAMLQRESENASHSNCNTSANANGHSIPFSATKKREREREEKKSDVVENASQVSFQNSLDTVFRKDM